jgi:hypothetical protein
LFQQCNIDEDVTDKNCYQLRNTSSKRTYHYADSDSSDCDFSPDEDSEWGEDESDVEIANREKFNLPASRSGKRKVRY